MHSTCPELLILLESRDLTILGEEHNLLHSWLCNFLTLSVTSSPVHLNNFLRTLFSCILNNALCYVISLKFVFTYLQYRPTFSPQIESKFHAHTKNKYNCLRIEGVNRVVVLAVLNLQV
jgi:hypothetical protein